MISEQLKTETARHHEAIENARRFSRLGADDFSKSEYIDILERFYGFYKPLEQAFGTHPDMMAALGYEKRFKLPLLERDLMALGHSAAQIASLSVADDLPPTATVAQALGCVYVMEGSTHGSQFIARRLRESLALTDGQGLSFYEGYGKDTMTQWKAFKAYLDTTIQSEPERQEVVDAAAKTFEALHRWMDA